MSAFFVIHHRDKAGCEEKHAEYAQKKKDSKFDKTEAELWDIAGFHAHDCMIGTGQIFCVWEAQEGKTAADMQAFIDSEMPFLNNVVYTVDASINGMTPKNVFGDNATPHCLADFPVLGEDGCNTKSKFYMVEHFCIPGMIETWVKVTESFKPKTKEDEEAFGKMVESMKEQGLAAHSSLPVSRTDGHVFCLWEVKEGNTAAELQAFHDGNMGSGGPKMMTNILHPIDISFSKGIHPTFGPGFGSTEGVARKGA